MTEQELTNKIIKNAQKTAADLIQKAEDAATKRLLTAQVDAETRQAAALQTAQAERQKQAEQNKKAAEVETIKARINARQGVIDTVFAQATSQLKQAPAATIKKIVTNLVQKYACPGDQISIGAAWAYACPQYQKATEIDAGIIIENATYRVELSLPVLLDNIRAQNELAIAQMLGVN